MSITRRSVSTHLGLITRRRTTTNKVEGTMNYRTKTINQKNIYIYKLFFDLKIA